MLEFIEDTVMFLIPNKGCVWLRELTKRLHPLCHTEGIADLIYKAKPGLYVCDVLQSVKVKYGLEVLSAWSDIRE